MDFGFGVTDISINDVPEELVKAAADALAEDEPNRAIVLDMVAEAKYVADDAFRFLLPEHRVINSRVNVAVSGHIREGEDDVSTTLTISVSEVRAPADTALAVDPPESRASKATEGK